MGMKAGITIFLMLLLCGCMSQMQRSNTPEREAWRSCINQANGSAEKVKACKPLLGSLHQQPQHQQFARQESVRVLDYERCLDAEQMGGGEGVHERCGKLWQEIQHANQ
ncbi:hypothetical protein CI789_12450 [Erwinia persicina]|nr:hypothetical protein CI789_12450 [Erwinia persicina]